MNHRGLWPWAIRGSKLGILWLASCTTYSGLDLGCEGAECESGEADGGATDGAGRDSRDGSDAADASTIPDAAGDVGLPACDAEQSPAIDACVIDDAYGIFVSPQGDDDAGAGTQAAPYATLTKGLAAAKAAEKRLYACDDGTGYAERVVVNADLDGLEAFGGFSCDVWAYGSGRKAKVKPAAAGVVWRFDELTKGFFLQDFEIEALDTEKDGESSIAVIVNQSAGIVFQGVDIKAGKAAPGTTKGFEARAAQGTAGNPGWPSRCLGPENAGGAAAKMSCGGVATDGGQGGTGTHVSAAGHGGPGLPQTLTSGRPGSGEGGLRYTCSAGGKGEDGEAGSAGTGARGPGSLDSQGWAGEAGRPGEDGLPGQGGGGGGGRISRETCDMPGGLVFKVSGPSGGSGGAGGCGGQGGEGGGAGGSSIALVSISSDLMLKGCNLTSSGGGAGGKGADGQGGGEGGKRGAAANEEGCAGGDGGNGGNGGPGGGGAGGHSLGIAYRGIVPTRNGGDIKTGDAGKGGAPGAGDDAAGRGEDGRSAEVLAF